MANQTQAHDPDLNKTTRNIFPTTSLGLKDIFLLLIQLPKHICPLRFSPRYIFLLPCIFPFMFSLFVFALFFYLLCLCFSCSSPYFFFMLTSLLPRQSSFPSPSHPTKKGDGMESILHFGNPYRKFNAYLCRPLNS